MPVMSATSITGLASIVIPCWNQLEFTRQCIAALKTHTRPPWELIVADNGSTDGTGAYLAGVQDVAAVPVRVISNRENRGFPAAVNQGLQQARGEYLVLLNNDVVVTDAWLDQLIALTTAKIGGEQNRFTAKDAKNAKKEREKSAKGGFADQALVALKNRPNVTVIDLQNNASAADGVRATLPLTTSPSIRPGEPMTKDQGPGTKYQGPALVGPMSNYATPPQLVENVPYRDIGEMHRFADRWRNEHRGQWFSVPKLSGFCLLMKRAVYDAIGGLDERFGLGFFDDDDLAERARRAGFELAVAHDLFVHHFGSRTFAGNGVDAEKLLDENAGRFAAK
jgi:glycosyltransferase involved in cell wall biosynthesis